MGIGRGRSLLVVLIVGALVLAACGSDSDSAATTETTSMTDEHMHDDAATTETTEADGHSHDGVADAMPWDGPEAPSISVSVTGDAASGWDIAADIQGLTFSSPTIDEHTPGEGHTHVFLDGELLMMSYHATVHVTDLEPGPHTAMVTLSRNDHMDYSLDDELLMGMAMFTVPGEATPADASFDLMYMNGVVSGVEPPAFVSFDDIVEITVHSDVAEQVHVHGYDLLLPLQAGQANTLRFTADIPGIFEVELEKSGVKLIELEVG